MIPGGGQSSNPFHATAEVTLRANSFSGPILSAKGITRTYGTGATAVHALRGVDFDLTAGELLVLLGPSGSGKSTLLNILGGLDAPTAGRLYFEGAELAMDDDRAMTGYRREHVGFVFQFYNLMASLTAEENVALVTEIATDPLPPGEALAMVGLADRRRHFPAELSGGEQQRVAIARAIAKRPRVLLCDEPTGALDIETGVLVLEALDRVTREIGAATALITHNVAIAAMADTVVVMADGRIIERRQNAERAAPSSIRW